MIMDKLEFVIRPLKLHKQEIAIDSEQEILFRKFVAKIHSHVQFDNRPVFDGC